MSERKNDQVTIYVKKIIRDDDNGDYHVEKEAEFFVQDNDYICMELEGERYLIKRKSLRFLNAFMEITEKNKLP